MEQEAGSHGPPWAAHARRHVGTAAAAPALLLVVGILAAQARGVAAVTALVTADWKIFAQAQGVAAAAALALLLVVGILAARA